MIIEFVVFYIVMIFVSFFRFVYNARNDSRYRREEDLVDYVLCSLFWPIFVVLAFFEWLAHLVWRGQ